MITFAKVVANLLIAAFGVVFGLWFVGSTMILRTSIGGVDIGKMTAEEATKAMLSGAKMESETFVSLWGLVNGFVPGQWIMWMPVLGFPIVFMIALSYGVRAFRRSNHV